MAHNTCKFFELYRSCRVCPWECGCNRIEGETGKCRCGPEPVVNDYMPHFGEEGCLVGERGSGAIFFSYCNLSCIFCQTADISQRGEGTPVSTDKLSDIMLWLQNEGCHNINLITPTHVSPSIACAIEEARSKGLNLPVVYNSGGYDRVETLRKLEGIVDIYLPDFKFWKNETAEKLCGASNYPEKAREAIKEMHRQVGDLVIKEGLAIRGLLIRHLVMPGHLEDSRAIFRFIATDVAPTTFVNVMEQYRPCYKADELPEIARRISGEEFDRALAYAHEEGLERVYY